MTKRSILRRGLESLERRDLMAADALNEVQLEPLPSLADTKLTSAFMGPTRLEVTGLIGGGEHIVINTPEQPDTGELTAEVVDGVLVIRGDAKGNSIGIWGWGQNKVFISARSVNGQNAEGSWTDPPGGMTFDGVTRGIDIDLGDGDDSVGLQEGFKNVRIRTGAGNDRITIGGEFEFPFKNYYTASIKWPRAAYVSGDLTIDTGDGSDELRAYGFVEDDLNVQMGAGDDSFVLPSWQVLETVTFAQLKGHGKNVIDLGADETPPVNEVPADWHSDPTLAGKLDPKLVAAFDAIEAAKADGSTLKGRGINWFPSDGGLPFATNRDGRLEIEFRFDTGEDDTYNYEALQLMEQLRARGLRMDRFSISLKLGYALIHESELAQFANLPAITLIQLRGVTDTSNQLGRPAWSYVRPASISVLDPPEPTAPPIGPRPPDDTPTGGNELGSLLDSFYGRGRVMGPMTL